MGIGDVIVGEETKKDTTEHVEDNVVVEIFSKPLEEIIESRPDRDRLVRYLRETRERILEAESAGQKPTAKRARKNPQKVDIDKEVL
jgi:hypothetical protein